MSDANRVGLAYEVESTFGVTPTGNPAIQDLRYVSESLAQVTGTVSSNELRSDRQVVDLIRTGLSAAGDINWELSYGAFDPLFEAAFLSATWTAEVNITPGVTFSTTAPDTIADSGSGLGSITVGSWIHIAGFADAANNGFFKVLTASASSLTVSGGTLVTESAGATVTIDQMGKIVNGTTLQTFTFEKEYLDLTNEFALFNGMAIDTMSLAIASDQIITGSFGLIGKAGVSPSPSTTFGDGSNDAAATGTVFNGVDDVDVVLEGQASYPITAFNMTLNNNLRARLQVATLGAVSLGTGTVGVTGTIQAYFNNPAVLDKYLANTVSQLAIGFKDPAGNRYLLDLPQVKYSRGQRVAGGINTDVLADLDFTAYRNSADDATISLHRAAA